MEIASTNGSQKTIVEIVEEHTQVQTALDRGFYRAVLKHRAGNVPMVFMRDGKIVEVDANDIPIPDDVLAEISQS